MISIIKSSTCFYDKHGSKLVLCQWYLHTNDVEFERIILLAYALVIFVKWPQFILWRKAVGKFVFNLVDNTPGNMFPISCDDFLQSHKRQRWNRLKRNFEVLLLNPQPGRQLPAVRQSSARRKYIQQYSMPHEKEVNFSHISFAQDFWTLYSFEQQIRPR
jgi:hypothetical protein